MVATAAAAATPMVRLHAWGSGRWLWEVMWKGGVTGGGGLFWLTVHSAAVRGANLGPGEEPATGRRGTEVGEKHSVGMRRLGGQKFGG